MAYDLAQAERIREVLGRLPLEPDERLGEMKMFGGLCFSLNGKMLVGVSGSQIMVRMEETELSEALRAGHVVPMDFTGKPLRNFAYLTEGASASDDDLLQRMAGSAKFVREIMMASPSSKRSKRKR
jgi:hypothetical protein